LAPVADHEAEDFTRCAVCERSILRGEQLWDYETAGGETRRVCALCRKRAEAAGWMPSRLAEELRAPPEPRQPAPLVKPRAVGGAESPLIRTERPPIERALDAFNASHETRKIAGLRRSLGEPNVAIAEGDGSVTVTVAWELSWYRWEVAPGRGVTQIAKGDEIAEIDPPDPVWNAQADDDGHLSLAP
jgi:hypothetical protein